MGHQNLGVNRVELTISKGKLLDLPLEIMNLMHSSIRCDGFTISKGKLSLLRTCVNANLPWRLDQ